MMRGSSTRTDAGVFSASAARDVLGKSLFNLQRHASLLVQWAGHSEGLELLEVVSNPLPYFRKMPSSRRAFHGSVSASHRAVTDSPGLKSKFVDAQADDSCV
jgi:hypothetical protein